MKTNHRLSQEPHIEEVARRNLVTLLVVKNSRSSQSVDRMIDRRSEGALIGRAGNIGPPSMTSDLHVVVLLS